MEADLQAEQARGSRRTAAPASPRSFELFSHTVGPAHAVPRACACECACACACACVGREERKKKLCGSSGSGEHAGDEARNNPIAESDGARASEKLNLGEQAKAGAS